MKKMQVSIGGMHCSSCSLAVSQAALSFDEIAEAKVDLKKGILFLTVKDSEGLSDEVEKKLKEKIEHSGFTWKKTSAEEGHLSMSSFVRFGAPILSILIFTAFILFDSSGTLARLFSNLEPVTSEGIILATTNVSSSAGGALVVAGVAFFMGLIASASSCLAMVGSVVIGFSGLYGDKNTLRPNLLFQGGRVLTFFVLGAFLGLVGNSFTSLFEGTSAIVATAIFQTILGVILLASAAMILGNKTVSSFVSRLLPDKAARYFQRLSSSHSPLAPILLGSLTFFIPCGFTQTAQAQALSAANPFLGAVILGAFALGTLPVLLVAGVSVGWSRSKGKGFFTRFAGFLVVLLALWTIFSGITMLKSAADIGFDGDTSKSIVNQFELVQENPQEIVEDVHTIEMRVKYEGFMPREIEVPAGKEIEWIIWGDEVTGCTNAIVVPALRLKFKIRPGKNVIRFRASLDAGRLDYSCWMGMVRARLVVIKS